MFCYTFVSNGLSVQHTSKPATKQKNTPVKIVQKVKKKKKTAQEFKTRKRTFFNINREITIAKFKP